MSSCSLDASLVSHLWMEDLIIGTFLLLLLHECWKKHFYASDLLQKVLPLAHVRYQKIIIFMSLSQKQNLYHFSGSWRLTGELLINESLWCVNALLSLKSKETSLGNQHSCSAHTDPFPLGFLCLPRCTLPGNSRDGLCPCALTADTRN